MNRFESVTKPMTWFMTLLLVAIVAGCGGGNGNPGSAGAGPTGATCTGASCVNLGTAANYAILASTGVSTVPSSKVTGNVGLYPKARIGLTGWSLISEPTDTDFTSAQVVAPGKLYAADNVGGTTKPDLNTAVLNMGTAYTDAAGRAASSAATTDVGTGTLTTQTFNSVGPVTVYQWGSAVTIPTDLTINGSATDVFILKVAGTLDMTAAKTVILTGGALAKNIFWQVTGAVTIGANAHFEGIILGQTSITFGNLASINGRLLAQTAVVLDATTVTKP
jgi:Ice-binding-like